MEQFVVQGGHRLHGEVGISGAKNAALGLLAAAVMADEDVFIRNIPDVEDVNILLEAIKDTGAQVERISRHEVRLNGSTIRNCVVDDAYIRQMRGGYYMLGALLGKYRFSEVAMPGGCSIGNRPIDQHLKGFEALGAKTEIQNSMVSVKADRLVGSSVYYDGVSVGATINTMLAAVLAEGRTVLENGAKVPHVVDVANCLNSMGARIKGAGTDLIRIDGVAKLHGTDYTVIPDQIEAGTFLTAAAATRGDVTVKNVIPKHLDCITSKLREIGCRVEEFDDAVRVYCDRTLKPCRVKTLPYPGFPTDMQAQMAVVLTTIPGVSTVTETVFDNRFKYTGELLRMGASVSVESNRVAVIEGVKELMGAKMVAPDLRAGAALVIAALAANGDSEISDVHYILRGYEDFDKKLQQLGGVVETVDSEAEARKFFMRNNSVG